MIQLLKNKLSALCSDRHIVEVARGMITAFFLKAFGAGLSFVFNIILARLVGAEGAGLYFLALSVTTISSLIGRIGLDNTILRFIAIKATNNDWAGVKGVYSLSMRVAVIVSTAMTMSAFLLAPWMATEVFKKPELVEPLRLMSMSILPFALLNLQSECLKGLKRIRDAMLIQSIGVPLIATLILMPLANWSSIIGANIAFLLSTIIVAVMGKWVLAKAIAGHEVCAVPFSFKELWKSCRPLFIVSLMNDGIRPWAPIFLIGIWSTANEVGIFGAAMRLVSLATFMLFTINNVLAPKLAELHTKGDMKSFATTARRSAGIITLLASPIFIFLYAAADHVMEIYGKEFAGGGPILAILVLGQVANVFTGSLGVILIVTGNERYTQNMTIASTALMLLLSFALIPTFGAVGAAIAISLSGTGLSLLSAIYVQRTLGINAIPLFHR